MRDADGYKDDDMTVVGRALMAAIERETADRDGPLFGWHPVDCPAEVVGDLVEMVLQARTITDDMVETACAAYVTEYCGGEVEWPDGWNPVRADDHRAAIRASLSAPRLLAEQSAPSPAPADLRYLVRESMLHHLRDCAAVDYAADAALSAIQRDNVILPREPTQAMFLAAEKAGVSFQTQQRCWNAFVSALAAKEEK